jgi:hypothetical protein
MTEQEIHQLRMSKWRVDGKPVRTLDDAREFIESVGFCLMYPMRPSVLAPTFMGAYAGGDENLPTWQHAFADPRAQDATDLMVRLLRSKAAFEANLFGETNFLVASSIFSFFYAITGDRNPRQTPKPGARSEYSTLAAHTFEQIQKHGPVNKERLRESLGGDLSDAALDRALNELWSKLRITRVDYKASEGAFWDVLFRWAPDKVREGMHMSVPAALSALVSKYLDCVIAAEQTDIEDFFANLVARSKVRESTNAMLAAREFSFVQVGGRSMIQLARARTPYQRTPRPERAMPRPGPKKRITIRDMAKSNPKSPKE